MQNERLEYLFDVFPDAFGDVFGRQVVFIDFIRHQPVGDFRFVQHARRIGLDDFFFHVPTPEIPDGIVVRPAVFIKRSGASDRAVFIRERRTSTVAPGENAAVRQIGISLQCATKPGHSTLQCLAEQHVARRGQTSARTSATTGRVFAVCRRVRCRFAAAALPPHTRFFPAACGKPPIICYLHAVAFAHTGISP